MAQTPANTAQSNTGGTTPATNGTSLSQEMTTNLKNAGFTDVKVVPDSFFVQAKDKNGNPITMLINPNSVTELVSGPVQGGAAGQAGGGTFVSSTAGDTPGSKLIGTQVHNAANQDIGTVKDLEMRNGQVQAYVLDVGSFLGTGTHYVAVAPGALTVTQGGNGVQATVNATQDQLRAAPSVQYPAAG